MTATDPTPSAPDFRTIHEAMLRRDLLDVRIRGEGECARLDEILLAISINALGPDARFAVDPDEWAVIEARIRRSAAAAADVAVERLASDLDGILDQRIQAVFRRIGDQRLRTELGYD